MTAINETLKTPMRKVSILTVSPIAYVEVLRGQIVDYFIERLKLSAPPEVGNMLNIALAPVGQSQPTHYACERVGWDAELGDAAAEIIRARKQFGTSYSARVKTYSDSSESLLTEIFVMESTLGEFCKKLSLGVIG